MIKCFRSGFVRLSNSEVKGLALIKRIAIITHRRAEVTKEALMQVLGICRELSVEVLLPEREVEKYPRAGEGSLATVVGSLATEKVDLAVALGGDGTILRSFKRFDGMDTPILGINFGRVGFFSAIMPDQIATSLRSMLEGEYELVGLSLLRLSHGGVTHMAVNDIVVHKPDDGSVINLGYQVGGIPMDSLRCDGLVVSTPAGSTAYNLSAGGPLVSLGLEAFLLTAIAPHTLRSRPLVLGPREKVTIVNDSLGATAAIYVDGRPESGLEPGDSLDVRLSEKKARLVQPPGAEFHRKLRDKFIVPPTRDS